MPGSRSPLKVFFFMDRVESGNFGGWYRSYKETEMFNNDDDQEYASRPRCTLQTDACTGYAEPDKVEGGMLEIGDDIVCLACYNYSHTNEENRP